MKPSALLVDFYELTMAAAYYEFKPKAHATFDLFVRKLPKDRTFLIVCGIDDVLRYLQDFSFSKDDIEYLKSFNFKPRFLRFLANQLRQKGFRLLGVRLDSGDLVRESKRIKKRLKESDLGFVKVFASGNLDEYKIKKLVAKNAQIDGFGVGTNMGVSADAPSCDVIYKMSEITNASGIFCPTMKFSQKKNTSPGRKQIYRFKNRAGRYRKDILALEDEKIKAEPLLAKKMQAGRLLHSDGDINKTREFVKKQLEKMPARFKKIKANTVYPVKKSPRLKRMIFNVSQSIKEKQRSI